MAELAANISGVLDVGTKLSIAMFDFASTLGAAGLELHDIATEVTLFSAVVRDFQKDLLHGGSIHSPIVVSASQEILDCCRVVIGLISDVLTSADNSREDGFIPSAYYVDRVKCMFQRTRVQVLILTLECCKLTLKLLLTTVEASRKVWLQRSFAEATVIESEEDRGFTQSLIIAQQCAIARLGSLEDEIEREDELIDAGRAGQAVNGTDMKYNEPILRAIGLNDSSQTPQKQQKLSIWLNNITCVDEAPSEPHPGVRQKRLSSASTDQQPMQLMRKWALLKRPHQFGERISEISQDNQSLRGSFSFAGQREGVPVEATNGHGTALYPRKARVVETLAGGTCQSETPIPDNDPFDNGRVSVEPVSPTTVLPVSAENPWNNSRAWLPAYSSFAANESCFVPTALDVSGQTQQQWLADTISKDVIKVAAEKYGLTIDKKRLVLSLVYGGRRRMFSESENPIAVFRQFQEVGLEPQMLLNIDGDICDS